MKRKFKMFMLYFRFYLNRFKSIFVFKKEEEEPVRFIYEDYRDDDDK
tara:strand:+ start:146 stop:286 length:141 start_codon:yes stop_codon:yes gene_type:complete